MNDLEAMLFAPQKVKAIKEAQPGYFLEARSAVIEESYIVRVRRKDRVWEYTVKHDTEEYKLPAAVVEWKEREDGL